MRALLLTTAVTALTSAACADDPSDVTAGDLVGLWGAVSMVYTSQADSTVRADLVGSDGATYSIELFSSGSYESQLSGPSVPTETDTGTYELHDRRLLLAPDTGGQRSLDLQFNRSMLTVHEAQTAWDFDGDGAAEPARLDMVLYRF